MGLTSAAIWIGGVISILGIATLLLGIVGIGCVLSIQMGPGFARRMEAAIHSIFYLELYLYLTPGNSIGNVKLYNPDYSFEFL